MENALLKISELSAADLLLEAEQQKVIDVVIGCNNIPDLEYIYQILVLLVSENKS